MTEGEIDLYLVERVSLYEVDVDSYDNVDDVLLKVDEKAYFEAGMSFYEKRVGKLTSKREWIDAGSFLYDDAIPDENPDDVDAWLADYLRGPKVIPPMVKYAFNEHAFGYDEEGETIYDCGINALLHVAERKAGKRVIQHLGVPESITGEMSDIGAMLFLWSAVNDVQPFISPDDVGKRLRFITRIEDIISLLDEDEKAIFVDHDDGFLYVDKSLFLYWFLMGTMMTTNSTPIIHYHDDLDQIYRNMKPYGVTVENFIADSFSVSERSYLQDIYGNLFTFHETGNSSELLRVIHDSPFIPIFDGERNIVGGFINGKYRTSKILTGVNSSILPTYNRIVEDPEESIEEMKKRDLFTTGDLLARYEIYFHKDESRDADIYQFAKSVRNLRGYENWFLFRGMCREGLNPIPGDMIIAYGTYMDYTCFSVLDLLDNIHLVDENTLIFKIPPNNDPDASDYISNRGKRIFNADDVSNLVSLISKIPERYRPISVSDLYFRFTSDQINILDDHEYYEHLLREFEMSMSPQFKVIWRAFLCLFVVIGMRLKGWSGPGHLYPYETPRSENGFTAEVDREIIRDLEIIESINVLGSTSNVKNPNKEDKEWLRFLRDFVISTSPEDDLRILDGYFNFRNPELFQVLGLIGQESVPLRPMNLLKGQDSQRDISIGTSPSIIEAINDGRWRSNPSAYGDVIIRTAFAHHVHENMSPETYRVDDELITESNIEINNFIVRYGNYTVDSRRLPPSADQVETWDYRSFRDDQRYASIVEDSLILNRSGSLEEVHPDVGEFHRNQYIRYMSPASMDWDRSYQQFV